MADRDLKEETTRGHLDPSGGDADPAAQAADEHGRAGAEEESLAAWTISVQSLRSGMSLTEHIFDDAGELLLSAGKRITTDFLEVLRKRGLDVVKVGCPTPRQTTGALRGKYEKQLDGLLVRMLQADKNRSGKASSAREPLSVPELAEEAQNRLEQHAAASDIVATVSRSCRAGTARIPVDVSKTVSEFLNIMSIDGDLLPLIVNMQEPHNEYLFDHCVNVSLLSMTVAARLGMDSREIMELGTGALLQDVGMLRVPQSIRLAPRALTADERVEVKRHALYTLDSLQRVEGLSRVTPFVGYQVHERIDGSGYPRGRSGMFIHKYAKIAAVMDVYAAMTHPRPYRPAYSPYEAMKEILREGSCGKLDRTIIRAFLDCVSLFPIGSFVELNGGVRAKVVRANQGEHTRPVVVQVNEGGESTGTVIDLVKEPSARVVRALPGTKPNASPDPQPAPLPG